MRIEVTQDLIDKGVRDSECECPIALAVEAHIPKDSGIQVSVTTNDIDLWKGTHLLAEFPNPAWAKIYLYDHGHKMLPFSLELDTVKFRLAIEDAKMIGPEEIDNDEECFNQAQEVNRTFS